jgi:FixJ family two-component response regulator
MGFRLTGSPSGNRTSSSVQEQIGATHGSQPAPVVYVVDEDFSVRQSLKKLIWTVGWDVETFASAHEFLARSRSANPCCLILDVKLPDLSGLELQARIAAELSYMPIIFLTDRSDVATTVEAMKAGAFEFFMKPCRDDILVNTIREALDTSRIALAQEMERKTLQKCYACLSRRERQVMVLVSSGLANKQVGGELGISEITVKAHRGQVMLKMQAASLPDLVRMAASLGLVKRFEAITSRTSMPQWQADFRAQYAAV